MWRVARRRGRALRQRQRAHRHRARARRRGHPRGEADRARADARRRLPREDRALARGRGRRPGRPRARQDGRSGLTGLANAGLLIRRSVVRTLRQPANLVFSFVFPMILLGVNSSGLSAATKIPDFPADSYLSFALAVPFVQGALFAANSAGTNIAVDIETGFLSRL